MSIIKKFPNSSFHTIYCTKLILVPDTTDLKWSNLYKHPDMRILINSDTIKTTIDSKEDRGARASKGFVVGTESKKWYFGIHEKSKIYVGMVSKNQDLNTILGASAVKILNVNTGDVVRFLLTTGSTLTIKHQVEQIDMSTNVYDLSSLTGETLYPWVSTNNHMTVKIMEDVPFVMNLDTGGSVHMKGKEKDIVDFNIEDIIEYGGGSVAPQGSTITSGSSFVNVESDGNININGGVNYKCENITSPVVSITLRLDNFAVMISNTLTTSVVLPSASDAPCQYYSIIRNYPVQVGEIWQNPVLSIIANKLDTIEGLPSCGIPPDSNIQVMSDGLFTWKIM